MMVTDTYIDKIAIAIAEKVDDPEPTHEDMRLYRIYALLAMIVGTDVRREHVHDAWAVWRLETAPDHSYIVPFDELLDEVKAWDDPYVEAIDEVAREQLGYW